MRSVDREEVSFHGGLALAGGVKTQGGNMRFRFLSVLVCALFYAALHANSVFATTVFATGTNFPETITQTASGSFFVTDGDNRGSIWEVPPGGGTASLQAKAGYQLRGGLFLPAGFGSVGGQFLVVGGKTGKSAAAMASTMDAAFTLTPYAHSAKRANVFWGQPVLAPSFGQLSGDVLIANQLGGIDFLTPGGTVGTLATLTNVFGAAVAPESFGDAGGTLLVSETLGPAIYSVDPRGRVSLFTTIPFSAGQGGLRHMAFAPEGWGAYSGDLFVSVDNTDIDVVNSGGSVIGRISGAFSPRGLLFTTLSGSPSLLFSDIATGNILKAGPGDVVPVP